MDARQLIDGLGGYALVAQRLRIEPFNVQGYTYRGRIPVKYWPTIIDMAREQGIDGVDAHKLMTLWIGGRGV